MGNRFATKIQYGKESAVAHGTPVAATSLLYAAPFPITPDRTPQYPVDQTGKRIRSTRSVVYEYLVRNTLRFDAEHPAYFQALPAIFSCGLVGGVTAVEQTTDQDDYLWGFTPDLESANAPDSLSLQCGDDVQAYLAEYAMFERIKVAGVVNQEGGDAPVTVEADFFARQWTAGAFTGSLALPSPTAMNAKLARFYLNSSWATVGTTEVSSLLRAFDIEIITGLHPKFYGSANRYFDVHAEGVISFLASFTFEGNSDADTIWDAFNAQSLQVARLSILGPAIGTGDPHSLIIDMGGTWSNVIPLAEEMKGNNLHTAVLHEMYDATGDAALDVNVTTNIAAI